MQLGSFVIEVLSEGRFEIFGDGHINRSSSNGDDSQSKIGTSALPVTVGINPILIKKEGYNILLDTGLGWGLDAGSSYEEVSNVCTNLEIFELDREDITHVILSHLHYDHAAGCSFTTAESKTEVTFPNATYYVHQREWEFALSQVENEQHTLGPNYQLDDFYRLVADERVEFLDGESTEILNGVTTIWTGGHTPGHQIVRIRDSNMTAYYFGDLLPVESQLNHYSMGSLDVKPPQAKKKKIQLLREAFKKDASLLFYHSLFSNIGRLEKDQEEKYVLKELE